MKNLSALKERLFDVHNIRTSMGLLGWDQQTCMPPGGARTRAAQLAALSKIAHEMFVDEETGRLMEAAEVEGKDLD